MDQTITQKNEGKNEGSSNAQDLDLRARELLKETRILNLARLANMLVDLFGLQEGFDKVKDRKGQEVEIYIPAFEGYLNFTLVSKKENFKCRANRAKDPVATVVMNVKEDKVLKVFSEIIRSKANITGLFKLVPKILTRKIKIKGSMMAALSLVKCLMIGQNKIYKHK
ncbi:MAG: hypothetical protein GF317_08700 [Candidatus Lokiarchaeota archaeon]|nr:hypothetical protein [Candidatus Lokiarchaeota archaeon]MBD3199794.1 hypothetical protein [Candidatus Lokiarchaeota archaeon]